ncbi:flagellar export protein FliJ [Acidihalobacter yilgarnensis]|uniref:Flagellar FliJ protein n=2 Tax=Acidihalobacter yilgarnensis TaxID=2819280 RepID=A0A1D8IPU0_9GAMM|nr:flagellar export protein FliJ [Acidihalobacter yilgarnensis]
MRADRLKPVQALAARNASEAAVQLAELGRAVEAARTRLSELKGWEQEYAQRMQGESMSMGDLLDYRLFLQRLADAGQAQQRVLEEAESAFQAGRATWLGLHSRQEALNQVVLRYEQEARIVAARREQRESDEFAAARGQGRTQSD